MKLWFVVALFVLMAGLTSADYCYQETANATSICGGLANGSYQFIGDWQDNYSLVDGNWSTGSMVNNLTLTIVQELSNPGFEDVYSYAIWPYNYGVAIINTTNPYEGVNSTQIIKTGSAMTIESQNLTNKTALVNGTNYTAFAYVFIPSIFPASQWGELTVGKSISSVANIYYYCSANTSNHTDIWMQVVCQFTYSDLLDTRVVLVTGVHGATSAGNYTKWDYVGIANETGNYETVIYVNYSIPINASNQSLWQVSDEYGKENLSVANCISSNATLQGGVVYNRTNTTLSYECYNGTGWEILKTYKREFFGGTDNVLEEAMWWANSSNASPSTPTINITILSPLNQTYKCSGAHCNITLNISANVTPNATWWDNGTANTTFVYINWSLNTTEANITRAVFGEGTNTIWFYANDSNGVISSANVTFYIGQVTGGAGGTEPLIYLGIGTAAGVAALYFARRYYQRNR